MFHSVEITAAQTAEGETVFDVHLHHAYGHRVFATRSAQYENAILSAEMLNGDCGPVTDRVHEIAPSYLNTPRKTANSVASDRLAEVFHGVTNNQ
ncbi:hypothetical protein [Palleronia abyssalis]|uniref:Uncharacterized protein n=1 Tax=Palleronia abyssalis TaxID=1501240 RepID=A0A2R8BZF7_9RHOB|nr:hypothetical protein [Palleronia abyssalis]SPJ25520.1 hypothetical protein PAA8504_03371 [Palleronia abyssalis]